MADIVYNSFCYDLSYNTIKIPTDVFYMMLVTSAYVPSRSHSKRSDITNEASGSGYIAGGKQVTMLLQAIDNTNNDVEIHFDTVTWTGSSITARGAVIYKRRGGAASADELVQYIDFGADKISSSGNFIVEMVNPLKFQYI